MAKQEKVHWPESEETKIFPVEIVDEIKEDAKQCINSLKKDGIDVYMLTGDNKEIALETANKLNIEYAVVNPTAGSHCGPDTVGICFYAKHK
jgi:P-type E1-E2 ATPase